jgi:two-component system sensor histidine kinase UhpB
MKLRTHLNLIVAGLSAVLVATLVAVEIDSTRRSVREEIAAANVVASQLLRRIAWTYARTGSESLRFFLEQLGRVRANEITLRAANGEVLYRSPPPVYKAGREAPRWFAALTLPDLAEQTFNLDDGSTLMLEANPSRAILDGWDDLVRLLSVGVFALLAIHAFTFWFIARALRPFPQIAEGLRRVERGDLTVRLPAYEGDEARAIGAAFNRMAKAVEEKVEAERAAREAEARLEERRELGRVVDQRLEEERRLIAHELHDEFGQSVTAIRSLAMAISSQATDKRTEEAARLISTEAARLYDAMHGLIPRLAPLSLDSLGLAETAPLSLGTTVARAHASRGSRPERRAHRLSRRAGRIDQRLAPCAARPRHRARAGRWGAVVGPGGGRWQGTARRLVAPRPFRAAWPARTRAQPRRRIRRRQPRPQRCAHGSGNSAGRRMIRVLLADDHAVVRVGFRLLLQTASDVTVAGEVESGEAACQMYAPEEHDVLVIDLSMPGLGGLEALRRIRARHPRAQVLALSAHDDAVHARRALKAGALGFLSKRSAPEALLDAVRAVAAGRRYIDAQLAQEVALAELDGGDSPVQKLSEREFEVFIRLARGASVQKIAEDLKVSASTVGTHLYNVKQKLGASNQAELTLLAIRHGLIEA